MPDNNNMPMQEDIPTEGAEMMQEHMHHDRLLNTLHTCADTCEHMTVHILRHVGANDRAKQLELLRDCADICALTCMYVARHSDISKYAANLCAYVCSVCGNECMRFMDEESQRCARICHDCAKECMAFANM